MNGKRKTLLTGIIFILATLFISVAGCGLARHAPQETTPEEVKMAPPQVAHELRGQEAALPQALPAERLIVHTAKLSLVVENIDKSLKEIKSIVKGLGGYVANSKTWHQDEQLRAQLLVRVPAASLEEALEGIKKLATKVENENLSGQDVTEEYTDLEARLRNLEATEEELRELLKTVREKTGKAEEILAIYNRLTEIRGQIEQVKGRRQYLEKSAEMAAVEIELIPSELTRPIIEAGWEPSGTLRNAWRALVKALQFIGDAFIWIVFFIVPVLVVLLAPIVLIIWLIWRWQRKRRKSQV